MRTGSSQLATKILPTLAALVVFALLFALGLWQLDRAQQKQALGNTFERRVHDHPIRLDTATPTVETDSLRHRRVTATGAYDAGHQFLLDNRTRRGVAGYHVLTPLRLRGSDAAVLVNRGWVPLGASREQLPAIPAPTGSVRVEGLVAVPGADPFLLGPAGYETGGWPRVVQAIDVPVMERTLGYRLRPYTVRLDAGVPGGFVREWRPYVGFGPERHRAYALQWFALAAAVAVIYVVVAMRSRRRQAQVR
ncbi:MAG: SURF1 family protein [Gammaproteobacteria bacterium]|nr:SURF1 family protein [Gammaproteobacteria bacterium]NIR82207.1 SURF1 family protein [Gammaproteobacteria bacterium]NIR90806.1 SURF1 family protein [Gammaproteobacteria bacterium]NIU03357.1 SURF1 family protein [Gammaproteobacteria bacterium]NIV50853.1 SURF1 family protein [Gammaproteobacteria bacterium]